MLGCGDTPVQDRLVVSSVNVTWFKALCAGGGNVTFGDSIYRSAGLIDSCSG